jgi:uncharacterized protein
VGPVNIRGNQSLKASRAAVFEGICDPNVLLGVIPGCREIEMTSETEYHGLISLRLPGIVGTYRTIVRLVEADSPNFGRLEGEVEGSLGTIKGEATFRLTDAGIGTRIDYEGTAVIGGPLARLDSRFIEGLAGSLINQGLRNLDTRLQAGTPAGVAIDRGQQTRETRA